MSSITWAYAGERMRLTMGYFAAARASPLAMARQAAFIRAKMSPMPRFITMLTIHEGASFGMGCEHEYEKRTDVGESGSTMTSITALTRPSLKSLPALLGLGGSSTSLPASARASSFPQCRTHSKKLPSRRLSQTRGG